MVTSAKVTAYTHVRFTTVIRVTSTKVTAYTHVRFTTVTMVTSAKVTPQYVIRGTAGNTLLATRLEGGEGTATWRQPNWLVKNTTVSSAIILTNFSNYILDYF